MATHTGKTNNKKLLMTTKGNVITMKIILILIIITIIITIVIFTFVPNVSCFSVSSSSKHGASETKRLETFFFPWAKQCTCGHLCAWFLY